MNPRTAYKIRRAVRFPWHLLVFLLWEGMGFKEAAEVALMSAGFSAARKKR